MHPKDKIPHSCARMWYINGPALRKTAILLILENLVDAKKVGSRNKTPQPLVPSFNIAPPITILRLMFHKLKIIDQDRKQVSREAREALHIRRNNPALNCNIGNMNIPKTFNQILGTNIPLGQIVLQTLIFHKILLQLPAVGPLGQ